MVAVSSIPEEHYWVEVGGDGRRHPFGMFKTVNRSDVEVVSSTSEGNGRPIRWVMIKDGTTQVWVKEGQLADYGYELQPDEQVSELELEAINLKHAALRDGSSISVNEAQKLAKTGDPERFRHALIAWYYTAKADPDISSEYVDALREVVDTQNRARRHFPPPDFKTDSRGCIGGYRREHRTLKKSEYVGI